MSRAADRPNFSAPPRSAGAGARAVALLFAWAGFYLLGLGMAGALLWVPYAEGAYGDGPDFGGVLAGIGGLWILWGLRPRIRRTGKRAPPLPPNSHQRLQELVADVARRAGHPVPKEVHLLLDANAHAAQSGGLFRRGASSVAIGLPFLAWLDRPEVEAIVAHELGHHLAGDVRLGPWVHRTRSSMAQALEHLEGSGFWLDLPFIGYAQAFLRYSLSVSRAQEYAADAVSARVAGKEAAAGALVVTEERSAAWNAYLRTEIQPMLESGFLPPLLEGFAHFEAAIAAAELKDDAEPEPEGSSKNDTHPTLRERLSALGVSAPPASARRGALELLDDAERAEEHVLRRILVNERLPLAPLRWEDAAEKLWLPRFRKRLTPFESVLRNLTPERIPEVNRRADDYAARLRMGLALFSTAAQRRHLAAILGTWYTVQLVDAGFVLETLPGFPVRARRGSLVIEPFKLLQPLADAKLDEPQWQAHLAEVRRAIAAQSA